MTIRYTFEDLRKMIEKDGWFLVRVKGSHMQFKHASKVGIVTIPAHRGIVPPGTANSILRQAGLKK